MNERTGTWVAIHIAYPGVVREHLVSLGDRLLWGMQQYGVSTELFGATAYVGFNEALEPKVNYFLCDGTADDVQIQAAIDYVNALGGGDVYISRGTYTIASTITITGDAIHLRGSCNSPVTPISGTSIVLADNADTNMLDCSGEKCLVENITFHGNKTNQAAGDIIYLTGGASQDILMTNIYVYRAYRYGFYLNSCGASRFINCFAELCNNEGWRLQLISHCTFTGCYSFSSGGTAAGITVYGGSTFSKFLGCEITYSGGPGIWLSDCAEISFIGCTVYFNQQHGVKIDQADHCTVIGCFIVDNGQAANNTWDGVVLDSTATYNIIKGNQFWCTVANKHRYQVNEIGAVDNYNIIMGNTCVAAVTAQIRRQGPNSIVRSNPGHINENNVLSPAFSIAAIAVVAVVIPHGLDITPAIEDCQLTIIEDTDVDDWEEGYVKIESVDAANVNCKVNVTNASATGGSTAKLALRVIEN